jgi:hypothetical protein
MRRFLPLLLGALLLAYALPGAVAAKPAATPWTVPQAVTGATTTGQNFTGTMTITRFANQGGTLMAIGSVTGTLTDAVGTPIGTATDSFAVPVVSATGTCAVLHLTLGPIDLNLLGLVVHLNQVVLNIDAQSGPGALLGNLLCAVAHLLDGTGPLGTIAGLLNQILAILSGLGI